MPIARHLKRSTRTCKRGEQPRAVTSTAPLCLTLLRVGFTQPAESPLLLVSFYLTVSPLPLANQRRFTFCCTCPNQTTDTTNRDHELVGRRYRPPCSQEPGLSSRFGRNQSRRPSHSLQTHLRLITKTEFFAHLPILQVL